MAELREMDNDNDAEDPYEARIRRSGCADHNYALQECYMDTKDWRKCREKMEAFRACMAKRKTKGSIATDSAPA